jgi:glycosyltransferase involved in cell wall biosynthesis
MLRILHCYSGNLYGGIERQLAVFAAANSQQASMHHEFALAFNGRLSTELEDYGAPVHLVGPVRLSRPWTLWRARRKLMNVATNHRFDIVICHASWSHLVYGPVLKKMQRPWCVWAHDAPQKLHWIDRCAFTTYPALLLANSNYTRDTWKVWFPKINAKTQYFPIPPLKASSTSIEVEARHQMRAALQTNANDLVILTAARFEEWKGHRIVLEALSKLTFLPEWKYWIAGAAQRSFEAERVSGLRKLATELHIAERVRWLGIRDDMGDVMGSSDVYCQPNLAPEPFGVVFVEAMHAGLPVVTSNWGGPVEFVDANCGRLVQPSNVEELSSVLRELIGQPALRKSLGSNGGEKAAKLFGLKYNLESLGETLAEVISKHRA